MRSPKPSDFRVRSRLVPTRCSSPKFQSCKAPPIREPEAAQCSQPKKQLFHVGPPLELYGMQRQAGRPGLRGSTILRAKYYTREVLGRLLAGRAFEGRRQQRIGLLLGLRRSGNLGERLAVLVEFH